MDTDRPMEVLNVERKTQIPRATANQTRIVTKQTTTITPSAPRRSLNSSFSTIGYPRYPHCHVLSKSTRPYFYDVGIEQSHTWVCIILRTRTLLRDICPAKLSKPRVLLTNKRLMRCNEKKKIEREIKLNIAGESR